MIRYDFLLAAYEPGLTLQKRYSIPIDKSLGSGSAIMRRNVVLSTIWGAARKHIENVAQGEATVIPQ
jgi:hypothetical protein